MDYAEVLDNLKEKGNFRSIPSDNGGMLDFSTNDYLGLSQRRDLMSAFLTEAARHAIALSASASRLLASEQSHFTSLERTLSDLYQRETLLFGSGYHANTGMISALADKHTLILADKLVHASIIDGVKLSGATMRRWRHMDFDHLERLMESEHDKWQRTIIVTESVYSMDGDSTDMGRLVDIKHRYPSTLLYVDEAHALGVSGAMGLGLCRSMAKEDYDMIDVVIGTFGKACASAGAFAAVVAPLRDFAINHARSFIFSTALPPLICAWTERVMRVVTKMDAERAHLSCLSTQLANGLRSLGMTVGQPSHIQPVMVGDARQAVELARRLAEDGIKVLPIRTPTVPPGTERLRISLSAAHSQEDIERLIESLRKSL